MPIGDRKVRIPRSRISNQKFETILVIIGAVQNRLPKLYLSNVDRIQCESPTS